ncbi:MAG TPA: BON domain-containing protein, partial [Candidatus Binatia bacterium]
TDRVRAEMEHLVRYPRRIHVYVDEGRVIFSGEALADERDQLLEGVGALRGVREVENRLQFHQGAEEFPGLEGELKPKPAGRPVDLLHRHWSPAARLLVGVASTAALVGLGMLAYGRSETNGGAPNGRAH